MSSHPKAFLDLIRDQFENEKERITLSQEFRELEDWSSMQALIVITAIDEAYGVTIEESTFRKAKTFNDLYTLVSN